MSAADIARQEGFFDGLMGRHPVLAPELAEYWVEYEEGYDLGRKVWRRPRRQRYPGGAA